MSIQVEILDLFLGKGQYWKMYDNFVYFFTFSSSDNKKLVCVKHTSDSKRKF